jgi:hypothetical protein
MTRLFPVDAFRSELRRPALRIEKVQNRAAVLANIESQYGRFSLQGAAIFRCLGGCG